MDTINKYEADLIDLGFRLIKENEYLYRGKHAKFIASIADRNTKQAYINLSYVRSKTDTREHSPNRGLHYRSALKQCISEGSVERAIVKYDLQEDQLLFYVGGATIKDKMKNTK